VPTDRHHQKQYLLARGGSRGAHRLFLAKSILFATFYTMSEKIFLKLNLDFIVAEIQSFWKCGGCMRVCVNRNRGRYCFLFCKGLILNDIRGHSDPKNICQNAGNRI